MTDPDSTTTNPADAVAKSSSGLWRVASLGLVLASAVIVTFWILQSRSASESAVENSRTLDVEAVEVVVDGLPTFEGAQVSVLGFDQQLTTLVSDAGTELELPSRVPAVVALLDDRGNVRGLSLVSRPDERSPVRISSATTAHTLLTLAPSLLEADIERTRQRVDLIMDDPAVLALVDELSDAPDLSQPNASLERAVGAILDRVPVTALPDQGCDSILSARALAVAGACAQTAGGTITVNNEQDRWIVAFAGPSPYAEPCAAIAPAGTPGRTRTLSIDECGREALIAAPGPIVDRSPERVDVINRVQTVTALQLFAAYGAPLVDLTGGAAGANRQSNSHILTSYPAIVALSERLIADEPGFAAALDVIVDASTPVERHAAALSAARTLTDNVDEVVDDRDPEARAHIVLLDFFDRVGEQMFAEERTERRWTADSWGVIPLEEQG